MAFEERYYREELDYLRQLGKLLAQEKPHLAHFLAEKEGDPDVERLMEAFAFMSGSLRQKLEDEFPEFTHGLIRMLWANYLRPVPAMTVIAYEPKTDQLKVPVQVCRNELIRSRSEKSSLTAQKVLPDNHDKIVSSVACHFTLARDIWLQPLRILDTRNASSLKEGIIDISFTADNNVSPAMLDLNKITFWLGNEDDYTRHQLYLWFCECLMDAELIAGEYRLPLPDLWLEAAGFDNRDALLPWPKNVHSGYRVLQEYFAIPKPSSFSICAMLRRYQTISRSMRLRCACTLTARYLPTSSCARIRCVCTVRQPLTCLRIMRNPSGRMGGWRNTRCAPAISIRTPMTFFRSAQSPVKSKFQVLKSAQVARRVSGPNLKASSTRWSTAASEKSSTGITGLKRPCFTTGLNTLSPLSMQTVAFRAAHGLTMT